jgi:hypothetical protein
VDLPMRFADDLRQAQGCRERRQPPHGARGFVAGSVRLLSGLRKAHACRDMHVAPKLHAAFNARTPLANSPRSLLRREAVALFAHQAAARGSFRPHTLRFVTP